MFNIVLYQPEIPPNTGNIIRLCANTGCHLHLVEPLGFDMNNKKLRRAGLDYREWAQTRRYANYEEFIKTCNFKRLYAFTTKARRHYSARRINDFGIACSELPWLGNFIDDPVTNEHVDFAGDSTGTINQGAIDYQ